MRQRFGVSLAAGATWSSATQKPLPPYSWIHIENRAVVGSGNDVLVDTLAEGALGQGVDGYWRYLAAGQRITDNACGPDDAAAEGLTLTNIGAAAVLLLVEIASTPIVHFSDFPTEATGGGGGGGTVAQGTAAALAGAWPVELTDGVHGPATVTAASALKVDGSAATQPVSQAGVAGAPLADAWSMQLTDGTHGPAAVKAASTAPVVTDPALVVTISPNSPGAVTGPTSAVVVAAGATTTQTVVVDPPDGTHSVVIVVNISAISGGETLTVTINGESVTGYLYPILIGNALNAVAVTPYRVGPALTPSANAVANDVVPGVLQVVAAIAGGGAVTYGIDAIFGA